MKLHTIVSCLFFMIGLSSWAQKEIYTSRNFKELTSNHKTIAIIPFNTQLQLEEAVSPFKLKQLEEQEAYTVQDALETYFLKRKKRKKFTVEFQDIQETNAILKKNNITFDNIDTYSPIELSKILGVDGVISGTLKLRTLISKDIDESFDIISIFKGKTDFGTIGIKISDGATGKLLWKYSKTLNRKTGRNTYAIVERMMRKASRKFPYDRD